jgi:hypothetical protein
MVGLMADMKVVPRWIRGEEQPYFLEPARHISAMACPGDRLFAVDYLPGVAQATNLRPATVVASAHYLYDSPYAVRKFRARVLGDLERNPPEFMVKWAMTDSADASEEVRLFRLEVQRMLDARYEQVPGPVSQGVEAYILRSHRCTHHRPPSP